MGYEGQDFSEIAGGVQPGVRRDAVQALPGIARLGRAVWRGWFEGLESGPSGASWDNPAWPPTTTDDLTAALDPTQMEPAAKPAKGARPGRPPPSRAVAGRHRSRPRAIRSAR